MSLGIGMCWYGHVFRLEYSHVSIGEVDFDVEGKKRRPMVIPKWQVEEECMKGGLSEESGGGVYEGWTQWGNWGRVYEGFTQCANWGRGV